MHLREFTEYLRSEVQKGNLVEARHEFVGPPNSIHREVKMTLVYRGRENGTGSRNQSVGGSRS